MDPNKRSKVIDKIAKEIRDEARDKGAKIDEENLKSVRYIVTLSHGSATISPMKLAHMVSQNAS
jgi:hypothetical protein